MAVSESELRIARGLALPAEDSVTHTFGILAKRGAGKSNAAAVMAEEMHRTGHQFVVVDPVGAWWGLRSSRDGTGPGLPVPILGGYHGDVPLESTGGELVADLVVDERLSCVIDCSAFESESAKRRFLIAFGEKLFRQKGKPDREEPLHLFLEEADDYAPQRAAGVEGNRCLGAFQRIVKQGRGRGLGSTMITQRSAVLNKDLLTQIDTLIVLRTTSPQDRKAIDGWVTFHDTDHEILASLSELETGEAWVWSPEFLGLVKRVKVRQRATFDSGATPKSGRSKRAPATLADVDLGALQARMADTIERAKADDPKALRGRIAQLERDLKTASKSVIPAPKIERVEVPMLDPEWAAQTDERLGELSARASEIIRSADQMAEELGRAIARQEAPAPSIPQQTQGTKAGGSARREAAEHRSARSLPDPVLDSPPAAGDLTGPQQKVLDALAWWEAVGVSRPSKIQVGFVAGYRVSKRVGGTYGNILGQLRASGLIDYPGVGSIELTEAGRFTATPPGILPTTDALQDAIYAKLGAAERRVLQVLVTTYPNPLSKQEAGERAGYAVGDRVGGTFGNILGRLRSLGLIDYPSTGQVVATPILFLEDAA